MCQREIQIGKMHKIDKMHKMDKMYNANISLFLQQLSFTNTLLYIKTDKLIIKRNISKLQTFPSKMHFFQKYRDMFEVGNVAMVPTNRLRLDNQLFIDRPYVPAYTQEHTLNSKLRQLKRDYNDFQSELKELQELQNIPKRSQSRRKQYRNQIPQKNKAQNQKRANPQSSQNQNKYQHHHHKSNIFNYKGFEEDNKFQENTRKQQSFQKVNSKHHQQLSQPKHNPIQPSNNSNNYSNPYPNSPQLNQKQNQFLQNMSSPLSESIQQRSPQKQYLQQLRRQNQQNTNKYIKNQNLLQNKMYQPGNNNVLKQSQINHVFNWKLNKYDDRLQNLPQTTIPKYKIQNSSLQMSDSASKHKNFMIRNRSNSQITSNKRNRIVPQHKQHNSMNKNSDAMQRRRIAKQNIDERRQKLKAMLRSLY